MSALPKLDISATALQSRVDRGDGAGQGADYRPFLTSESSPNSAHSGKYVCPLTGRVRHFASESEEGLAYGVMRDRHVVEARENFRLAIALTRKICVVLGLQHPISSGEGRPLLPFTTDLLVVRNTEPTYVAYGAKTRSKLKRFEHWRSLLVEHVYWTLLGVPYYVVTDLEIGKNRLASLQFLHPRKPLPRGDWNASDARFLEVANGADWSPALLQVVRGLSDKLGIDSKEGLEAFKRLAWLGELQVDLSRGISEQTRNAVHK